MNVQILSIKFSEDIDEDTDYEISECISTKNIHYLLNIVNDLYIDEIGIFSISFMFKDHRFKMTRYAVAELDAEEVSNIRLSSELMQSPLIFMTGLEPAYNYRLLRNDGFE
ncbi:MAG: hypothetical protein ACE3JK_18385 [Sporolactobacillus sp.]